MSSVHPDVQEVLISEEELAATVRSLGEQISRDYAGKNLLLVGILKGSVLFMSDLMRNISLDCNIDFMRVSSYGAGTSSSGKINIELDLRRSVKGYDVLIIEDILDSGNTLSLLKELLIQRGPESVKICTLLDKPERHMTDIKPDYIGKVIPNYFVIGYGLDYDEKYRNLPYVGILRPEVYE
ncbi:MAG: hypoxanthine phosphoribosyltransferase [Clostridia bacterium]|nr:hypoxanthine phosphoribosyltransferase [Clostridia bacterium]MBP5658049.1 hypoxanthine phosphoribosyltransferase [Clostridia bacterium]